MVQTCATTQSEHSPGNKKSPNDLENLRKIISSLRDKNDILEDKLGTLKADNIHWDIERRRLERELKVQDDKLKDVTRDLSLSREAEKKAVKRYDEALGYSREVEVKIDELRRGFDVERDDFLRKLREFKEIEVEFEVLVAEKAKFEGFKEELEELRRKNEVLGVENAKLEGLKEELECLRGKNEVLIAEKAELEGLKEELGFKLREKEGENADIGKKCVQLNCELKKFKNVRLRNEELIKEITKLKAEVKEKDEKVEELIRKNEVLEAEINKNKDELECLIDLENERFEITSNKNVQIKELVKEKEGLEKENMELMELFKKVEESFIKLEGDVVNYLCVETKRDYKFGSSQVRKFVSGIIDAIDKEQECRNLEEDPAFVRHANDIKFSSVTKTEEDAKTTNLSEEELSGENEVGAAYNHRSQSPAVIQISDSDDDEISCHVSGLKRARTLSVCSIRTHSNDISSDESLNQKRKIRKLEHEFAESAKQTTPFLRECKENQIRNVKTPVLEGNDDKQVSRNNKTEGLLEYMAINSKKVNKIVIESAVDMAVACRNDPEFCTYAVCALYRNGLLCSGQSGIKKYDIDRAIALAKFLVDGDPNSDKKSTMDELKQHDPRGLDTCRELAEDYREKLFDIFKSNQDPFFSHLKYR